MKIQEALLHATYLKSSFSSVSAEMENQDVESLMYWILLYPENDERRLKAFNKVINATDWEVDDQDDMFNK